MKSQITRDEITRELTTLIKLARSSGEPNCEIVDYLALYYEDLQWTTKRLPRDARGQSLNLLVSCCENPTVMFCAHTDTVPPGQISLWTETGYKPRQPRVKGDLVYGLGASDNLGSIAALNLISRGHYWPESVAILFSADEEVGALGAADALRMGIIPQSVRLAVVCEPTNNLIVCGEKGYVPFDVVARGIIKRHLPGRVDEEDLNVLLVVGQEAHSARPEEGRNALFEAARMEDVETLTSHAVLRIECQGVRNKLPGLCAFSYVSRESLRPDGTHTEWDIRPVLQFLRGLEEMAERLRSFQDERFRPAYVTLNVGGIVAFSDEVSFACDLRTIPGLDHRQVLNDVAALAKASFPDTTFRFPHPPLPALWTNLSKEFVAQIGDRIDPFGKSAYTEAAIFVPAGIPTIIAGPGNLLVHRPNEYIEVGAIEKAAELYVRIAKVASSVLAITENGAS